MKSKKALIISIVVFVVVAIFALYLVLNKGHIGNLSLVSTGESQEEKIQPKLEIILDKQYLSSKDDEDVAKITATIDGEIATENVDLEVSDSEIIAINEENEIVPLKDGKATVKATYDGIEAIAKIEVITPIKTMSFTSTNSTIRVGKDLQLKLKVTPSDAYMNTLKYTSSDESIATVTPNGIVTGIAPGKVTITLFDTYTEMEKTVNLTIRK